MKNLLIILSLTFVFACHTKVEQKRSGINDPTNLSYNDIDSSVLSYSNKAEAPEIVAPAPQAVGCIDSSKIQKDALCTQEFKPVCGCDGKQYSNSCEAEKSGLTQWTEGPCEKKTEGSIKTKPEEAPKTAAVETTEEPVKKKKKRRK